MVITQNLKEVRTRTGHTSGGMYPKTHFLYFPHAQKVFFFFLNLGISSSIEFIDYTVLSRRNVTFFSLKFNEVRKR